ncbi:MAG TPA: YciI family protein [Myxococcaceae bacterium]
MRFLMTYQQDPNVAPPTPEKLAAIGAYTQKNMQSGVVVMTGGLVRPDHGTKVKAERGKFSVIDGPFAETKELIDGFAVIEVPSKAAAIAVAQEFMQLAGDGTGEILQMFDPGGPPPAR